MSWWGKVLGGAFGYLLGGPLGALIGAALGHKFDQGMNGLQRIGGGFGTEGGFAGGEGFTAGSGFSPGDRERVQTAFFTASFSVMGHLSKADGRVSPDEIRLAETVMAQMKLAPEMRKAAVNLFNQGKAPEFQLDEVLDQFRRECHRRQTLIQMFIEIQLQAAYADGRMDPSEERLLEHMCDRLGFPREALSRLEEMLRAEWRTWGAGGARGPKAQTGPTTQDAYAILNVSPEASDADIKRAYRRLMSQHHPDKLVSKGLPEEMMEIAKQKTQEIRQAYEVIKEKRKLH